MVSNCTQCQKFSKDIEYVLKISDTVSENMNQ